MDVEIKGMAYSPVERNLDNSDQWQETADNSVANNLELIKKYVRQVVIKTDISDVTVGEFDGNTEPKEWLDTIKDSNFSRNESEFCQSAKRISEKLNDMLPPNSNEGVLFVIQAEIEGGNLLSSEPHQIASILKLDLEEEERLQLRDDRSLETLDLEDIFPDPKELQKGLIYPVVKAEGFRLPGDVKFYQKDNVSDYFQEFLECRTEPASLERAKKVFKAIGKIKKEVTGQSVDGDDLTKFKELQRHSDGDVVGIDEITSVASDIVGDEVTGEEIAEKLGVDDPESIAVDSNELPNMVKYKIDDEIDIKFPSSASERVTKEQSSEGVEVRITGADIDTTILDK